MAKPYTIEQVVIGDIEMKPGRREADPVAVQRIKSSIEAVGLRTPITVRFSHDVDGETGEVIDRVYLVTGRHRLEACRALGWSVIPAYTMEDGDELDAQLWEISENLHRAELTVQERAEQIAEWVRLSGQKAQLAPIESKRADGRGHRQEGGINAAVRELGIDRTEAQRAVKIAALPEEAKHVAREAGLDNNQSALLAATKAEDPAQELRRLKAEKYAKEAARRNRETDRAIAQTDAQDFAEWLIAHGAASELQQVIAWLEGAKPKDVISALKRGAA
jgi:ParB family chromosome partitioning protein